MGGGMRGETGQARKLTYADFLSFPEDGRRHELIDGAHYVTPAPVTVHQRLLGALYVALHQYLENHPIGEVFLSPIDVVLSDHDVVEPDLLLVLDDQSDLVTEKHLVGAPALVIEILSPTTRARDRGIKRRLFERTGVREYWLVDPRDAAIDVYRARQCELGLESSFMAGDTLTSPLLPGFALELRSLFVRVGLA
jgi:Uma2 family endonuclease